jgi:hypothetical protein
MQSYRQLAARLDVAPMIFAPRDRTGHHRRRRMRAAAVVLVAALHVSIIVVMALPSFDWS